MEGRPTTAGQRALREHLERDAPQREASVARFMLFATAASAIAALALRGLIGARLSTALALLLAAMAAWYAVLLVLLRRGWFAPPVAWLNVALEVSAPALIFLADVGARGPEYALTAPPLAIQGTLVGMSALRGSRALAVAAGALAALEYLALYVFVAAPRLPSDVLVTLQTPLIATRAFLLFCAGLATAGFIAHFNRRAAEALSAVRERDVLGKYLLHERIGAGGMAEVYRASYCPEGGFEKTVAVKKILPGYAESDEFIALFRQEAALCSHLNHANVVQVLDFGRFGDTYFLAMEYVEGVSLKKVLDAHAGRGLPLAAVTYLGAELCKALDYVHTRADAEGQPLRLVHRDVNPPNILVSKAGEVKLTDFGIARANQGARLTQAGYVKGKPGYMAPEQLADEALDGRTDLFALGLTLHEALTGAPLISTGSQALEAYDVLERKFPPPSALRPDVPQALDAVVMGLLDRDLSRRTPSAVLARLALEAVTGAAAVGAGQRALANAVRVAREAARALPTGEERTRPMPSSRGGGR
jgi:serine/threonine-protein kinase